MLAAQNVRFDLDRVVLASKEEKMLFIEVADGSDFRSKLEASVAQALLPPDLLGWKLEGNTIQDRSLIGTRVWYIKRVQFGEVSNRGGAFDLD